MQVYIDSPIILNGVCLRWKGYINLEKLDGVGGMKFDEDSSRVSWFNPIPTGLGHVTLIYGLIPPMAGRNRVKGVSIQKLFWSTYSHHDARS